MQQPTALQNRLLARLSKAAFKRLLPQLEPIEFVTGQIIYEARAKIDYVYFPVRGVLSALAVMRDVVSIEVGNMGYEGAAGAFAFMGTAWSPNRVIVQADGEGVRIKAVDLEKAAENDAGLRSTLLRYHSYFVAQISQSVACNGLHQIPQRCCRWLLMSHDRAASNEFNLTHEFLAMMLGVRRSGVTEILIALREQGLIENSRGNIKIVHREGLEAACCECYALTEKEYDRLIEAN